LAVRLSFVEKGVESLAMLIKKPLLILDAYIDAKALL
jgi:hypothetical protein